MRRLLPAPLVHFLLLGAALLAVRQRWSRDDVAAPADRIVVSAADRERLRAEWNEEHGTAPDARAEAALVRAAVDEEVLYREAIAAGLDRRDGAVAERLVRLGGFVSEDATLGRDGLEREARRLGLARDDVVVRRHLVQMMRLAAVRPAPGDLPADAELQAYLDAHAADFAAPARLRLTHVYLSADSRGADAERDADLLLADLRRRALGPDVAATRGDPFLRGSTFGPASHDELVRIFGGAFAHAVEDAPTGTWAGPVRSTYGFHLVWVSERLPSTPPPLAVVRSRVVLALLRERGARRAAARMQVLRARYAVTVEGEPALAP